jgi:protein dithiol oxidoreductase (disulfide-forming)
MKLLRKVLIIAALFLSIQAIAEPVAGKDYKVIDPPQPTHSGNKIEVLEFFFYGCSHCFDLHPHMTSWEKKMPKDVELVYVPTIFNANWEPMAYTYYALEVLGKNHELHHDLYEAWNVKNVDLGDLNKISNYLAQFGVDKKKFADAYQSFGVQSKVTRSKQMSQTFNIRGTPTLIIDGKYLITGLQPAATVKVMSELLEKLRKDRAGKR